MTPWARFRVGFFASLAVFAGCGGFGQVNQGQVIGYQRSTGLITLIGDSNYRNPASPRFDVLPAGSIRIPKNPEEMGPEPAAGKLLGIDYANRHAIVFDAATQAMRTVPYTLISQENNVYPDDARVSHTRFPVVDRARKTIWRLLLPRPQARCLRRSRGVLRHAGRHLENRRRGPILLQGPGSRAPPDERQQDRLEQGREMNPISLLPALLLAGGMPPEPLTCTVDAARHRGWRLLRRRQRQSRGQGRRGIEGDPHGERVGSRGALQPQGAIRPHLAQRQQATDLGSAFAVPAV